jgi:hypothetical protein
MSTVSPVTLSLSLVPNVHVTNDTTPPTTPPTPLETTITTKTTKPNLTTKTHQSFYYI